MRRIYILVLILGIGMSCEDVTHKKLLSQDLPTLAVQGVITSEAVNHKIHLSHLYQEQNAMGEPITGAEIALLSNGTTINLVEFPSGSGDYYTPVFKAVTNLPYTLIINLSGAIYTATDVALPVEPLDTFQYSQDAGQYTIAFGKSGSEPNYIEYYLDWSSTQECAPGAECKALLYYYDLKTSDVNEIFKPDAQTVRFPAGTIVVRKKYSVSPEYREFLRGMLSETVWHGGTFDVQPGPVPTNVSGDAVGFFAASTVAADTTIVQ